MELNERRTVIINDDGSEYDIACMVREKISLTKQLTDDAAGIESMSEEQINSMVERLSDITDILDEARLIDGNKINEWEAKFS